jgi:hypothetical protein
MLLRFGTSNFASFRDFQELSLVASSLKDDQSDLLESNAIREKLLAAAVIYGANAAGKSNLLQAFAFMRDMIVNSHSKSTPTEKIDPPTFALDPELAAKETKFDVDFIPSDIITDLRSMLPRFSKNGCTHILKENGSAGSIDIPMSLSNLARACVERIDQLKP